MSQVPFPWDSFFPQSCEIPGLLSPRMPSCLSRNTYFGAVTGIGSPGACALPSPGVWFALRPYPPSPVGLQESHLLAHWLINIPPTRTIKQGSSFRSGKFWFYWKVSYVKCFAGAHRWEDDLLKQACERTHDVKKIWPTGGRRCLMTLVPSYSLLVIVCRDFIERNGVLEASWHFCGLGPIVRVKWKFLDISPDTDSHGVLLRQTHMVCC